jgi:hypothetical protein
LAAGFEFAAGKLFAAGKALAAGYAIAAAVPMAAPAAGTFVAVAEDGKALGKAPGKPDGKAPGKLPGSAAGKFPGNAAGYEPGTWGPAPAPGSSVSSSWAKWPGPNCWDCPMDIVRWFGVLASGTTKRSPHSGQTPFLPARNDLTFSLWPCGQRNLMPIERPIR